MHNIVMRFYQKCVKRCVTSCAAQQNKTRIYLVGIHLYCVVDERHRKR